MQEAVLQNPYDYELHFKLIQECRDSSDFVKARDCRNFANSIFPLTAQQWAEWISDEMASTPLDTIFIMQLYQRATSEVSDIDLWEEYLDFVLDQPLPKEEKLIILHGATSAIGWHFTKGFRIWEKVLSYEVEQLDTKDVERVRSMFYKRAEMLMSDVSFDSLLILYSGFESKVGVDYEDFMKKFNSLVFKLKKECKKRDFNEQKLVFLFSFLNNRLIIIIA